MKSLPPSSNNNHTPKIEMDQETKVNAPTPRSEDRSKKTFEDPTLVSVEKGLGKVDKNLVNLLASFKSSRHLDKLTSTLQHVENEIKSLLSELKKQLSPEEKKELKRELGEELKKFEDELKEVSKKMKGEKGSDLEDKKDALDAVQGQISTLAQQLKSDQLLETQAAGATGGLAAMDTRSEVSKTITLISKMVSQIQVGSVEGKTFTNVELKSTTDVPSYFANANMTITPGADGKMTVQFTNLTAEQTRAAILAIEQHPELLLSLLNRVNVERIQIGDQTVKLPETEAGREEGGGGRDRGGDEGGREGREEPRR
jgi:hypothetical protein